MKLLRKDYMLRVTKMVASFAVGWIVMTFMQTGTISKKTLMPWIKV